MALQTILASLLPVNVSYGVLAFTSFTVGTCFLFVLWNCWILFVEIPKVYYQASPINTKLLEYCPSLKNYRFPVWGYSNHFQTLYNSVLRRFPLVPHDRERMVSSDGGVLILDWIFDAALVKSDSPILIVVPGICNSIHSHYIRSFVSDGSSRGYRVVVVNARGVVELATPKLFTLGQTDDLRHCIQHVHEKFPNAPLVAVGFSLGGNMLSKYIGEESKETEKTKKPQLLIGAIAISQGYDGIRGIQYLKKTWLYNISVSKKLTRLLKQHAHLFKGIIDIEEALRVRCVEQFDRLFTCKLNNFPDTETYYHNSSSIHHLPSVTIPLLLVNALDDPIVDRSIVPIDMPQKNHNVILVTTEYGGHLAWCEGSFWPSGHWHERLALEFVEGVLKENQTKINQRDDSRL